VLNITTNSKILKHSRDHNHAPFVGDMSSVARIDIAYNLWTKFDDFWFCHSSAMIGAQIFLMDHMTWPRPYQGRFVLFDLHI